VADLHLLAAVACVLVDMETCKYVGHVKNTELMQVVSQVLVTFFHACSLHRLCGGHIENLSIRTICHYKFMYRWATTVLLDCVNLDLWETD
jgi:hypothetical protein